MTLKRVVFPAPLGPMSPMISFGRTWNDTSFTAVRPPKCFVTFSSTRIGSGMVPDLLPPLGKHPEDPIGQEDDTARDDGTQDDEVEHLVGGQVCPEEGL